MSTTEKALKGTAARSGADIRDAGPGLCHQADAGNTPAAVDRREEWAGLVVSI